ncbi:MAG: posphoenolpyruvate synthetase regulatory kinase/phosphorylase PpsR [Arenicella sp.]
MIKRNAFIISDRTGITAQALGNSLLSQFPDVHFAVETLSFVDSKEKADRVCEQIKRSSDEQKQRPIVFATLVDDEIREIIAKSHSVFFDLFDTFVDPLEKVLGVESSHKVGLSHGMANASQYAARISAMNYSLETDDGIDVKRYNRAQVIVVGVSRSGKTPTCLYLSLQYGIFAANYPLTEEDLKSGVLSPALAAYKDKLIGLTIDPFRLQQIRQERYNRDSYASAKQCQYEIATAESIFRKEKIPMLNSTQMSVEELGAKIMQRAGLAKTI